MIEVRTINHTDIEFILPMQRQLAIDQGILDRWKPDRSRMKIQLGDGNPKIHGLIALLGDKPIGYCLYHLDDYSSFQSRWRALFVDDYFVAPEDRGKGVGRTLLTRLAIAVTEHGVDYISLDVHTNNKAAKEIYDHVGASTPTATEWERLHITGDALTALQK